MHRAEVIKVAALDFTFERREKLIRRDSLEKGIELGRQQGIVQGVEQGRQMTLISMVCRKLVKGKSAAIIAQELEEAPDIVEDICKAAKDYAPDYDAVAIYEAMQR